MNVEQVAAQLYTLRDFSKTAAEYADTLKKVRAMGYKAIQISGVGAIPPAELRSIAEGEGLTICATHEPAQVILDEPASVVERLAALGTKYTAYPYPAGVDFSNASHVDNLIAELDAAGAVLREAGQVLTYHNHANEFHRVGGVPLLHLKDYAVDATGKPYFAEIGQGNLDFKAIIAAAEASGCEWFIVEQDVCPGNPFDSLKLSIDYIKAQLVG